MAFTLMYSGHPLSTSVGANVVMLPVGKRKVVEGEVYRGREREGELEGEVEGEERERGREGGKIWRKGMRRERR